MGRMSELDAELRQYAEPSVEQILEIGRLIVAAQAAVKAFEEHGYSPLTIRAIWALRDVLAEERLNEFVRR